MKRIDLVSKLFAPIFISFVAMLVKSQVAMSLAVAGMNVVLLLPEWLCAKWVWSSCAKLREPRLGPASAAVVEVTNGEEPDLQPLDMGERWGSSWKVYFNSNAWRRMTSRLLSYEHINNLSSVPFISTSVLLCALIVGIDDDLPPECPLYFITNHRSSSP